MAGGGFGPAMDGGLISFYALTDDHQELLCDYISKWIDNKHSNTLNHDKY